MEARAEDDSKNKEEHEKAEKEEPMEEDDDSDSSEESDDEVEQQISLIEQQVAENPYMYDGHTQLIQKLRAAGELNRLQKAREHMASIFPLTAEIWLEWIEDEKKVMEENDRSHINDLFERAVKDYTTFDLWLEYIQFSIGGMSSDGGIEAVRSVCERAITATGLHVSKGCLIWEAFREYENAILIGLQPAPGSTSNADQQEQINAQTKRVLALFRRQLSIPLNNMLTTWEEFKDFAEEEEQEKVRPLYERALKKLEKLLPYEDALFSSDNLSKFEDYIDFELENGEPARIQCIFERALVVHCLIPRLWIRYTQYLYIELKIPDLVVSVYERAVRNCPWSAELWCGYGRAMERYAKPHSQTKEVFVRALSGGFTSAVEYLAVWNAHLDYLRRRVPWDKNQDEDPFEEEKELWQTFDEAIQYMSDNFGRDGDPESTLLQYMARLKAKHCKDMVEARETWNKVMQAGHGSKAAMWLEYFNLERAYGDHKHARKILQRALNSANDWPETIVQAYIRFEREEGDSIDAYDSAVCRCEAQMARIEERRAKAEIDNPKENKDSFKVPPAPVAAKRRAPPSWKRSNTQGTPSDSKTCPPGSKHSKTKATPSDTSFTPGSKLPQSEPSQEEEKATPPGSKRPKAPPPGYKGPPGGRPPPPGYKGPPGGRPTPPGYKGPPGGRPTPPGYKGDTEETEEPAAKKPKVEETADASKPFEVDPSHECRTAFVSNLNFNATEEDVRNILEKAGEITDFRLVKSFTGKSKGYAYVEFKDELMVAEAVQLDRTPIDGRPMFVTQYNKKSNNAASFKYATHMEKNKLFVRGLPHSMTKEDIENLFAKHGKLKEVRLVTYRSGSSKGLAYVDFIEESDASQAVMKMDGHVIGQHTINVAISNPPPRKAPAPSTFVPSLGGGRRDTGGRGRSGTQLAMMPRSLQQQPANKPASEKTTNGSGETAKTKMSNSDFRAMLLKR